MLKHELERVWITSDEKKFLCIDDALNHEENQEDKRAIIQVNEVKFDRLIEELKKELENNCQENTREEPTDNWSSNG